MRSVHTYHDSIYDKIRYQTSTFELNAVIHFIESFCKLNGGCIQNRYINMVDSLSSSLLSDCVTTKFCSFETSKLSAFKSTETFSQRISLNRLERNYFR